jgi:hypothetical protein
VGCFAVYRDGERFELHSADRWTVIRVTREPVADADAATGTR